MEKARILIVEDDRIFAEVAKKRIVAMGYLVAGIVTSGEDAISAVRKDIPDLVLMDIALQGEMDGIEAASQIKLTCNVPVIYVTAHADHTFLNRAKLTTPLGYILKPFEPETMKAAIEIALYRHTMEEQKAQLESQNRQLQKSESLGRMAAAIAHHFNNKLGAVIGNLELALMEVEKGAPPQARINAAMEASYTASEMSRLMLTYLGQSFDKRDALDLSETCRIGLPLLQAVMPGNVLLDKDLPSPGPVINANANQIQQVLTNLITNAEEAGGTISLGVKKVLAVEISTNNRFPVDWQSQDNAYACLEVADTGCGIDRNDIEKLFDPFYSTKFTGRGLGLPVVLGIVKTHKGVVTVESEPCRGSTLRVFFPVSGDEIIREQDKVVNVQKPEEGGTVLLVEDEEMLRDMATDMLVSFGFSVLKAKDGIEALEVFGKNQNEIKFVLTDLTMPRMNGWETLTALRKLQPDIPVILSSGYDKARAMEGDHPDLPQAFLGKPYNLKTLSDAIRQALERKKT